LIGVQRFLTQTNAKTNYELNPRYSNNPFGVLAGMYEMLYKTIVPVTITTLPMFHLSDQSVVGRNCVIVANEPKAVAPNAPESKLPNAFFSGHYQIRAFKHIIDSKNQAKSVFMLYKLITANQENLDNNPYEYTAG